MNSSKNVKRAIEFEIKRQISLLENKEKVVSLYDHKRNAKIQMYYWTFNRYEKQLKKFESKQSEDPELLDEIYKLQDRFHYNYLKKTVLLLFLN